MFSPTPAIGEIIQHLTVSRFAQGIRGVRQTRLARLFDARTSPPLSRKARVVRFPWIVQRTDAYR